jgi:hypothetical protein
MKIIIEFDGNEEQEEYRTALDGWKYRSILNDIREMIRSKEKYLDEETISLEELRQYLVDKLSEYEVPI